MEEKIQMTYEPERPKLSICIATYNRDAYIAATLDSILDSLPAEVEVVIVDGASPDNTAAVVAPYVLRNDAVRYFREPANSGVDRDYDRAVCYARGGFCWLMTDDDILVPGAVSRVLAELEPSLDLLVVNSQVRSVDLGVELNPRILKFTGNQEYDAGSGDRLLGDAGGYLSFIGAVVIRRSTWLEREREPYFGTLFIHVGVIFQAPLERVKILADPLITIRYGNAMWTSRGFEIWMFKWPALIWSFSGFSDEAKLRVVSREPWRQWGRLLQYRALGCYSYPDFLKLFRDKGRGGMRQLVASLVPAVAANCLAAIYGFTVKRKAREAIYDLARSRDASRLTRLVARSLGMSVS
jgi:glycosyltransferase involved in cell wall biosynthesis